MNSHTKWLRQAGVIATKAGLVNVGNTCEQAAAEIDRLEGALYLLRNERDNVRDQVHEALTRQPDETDEPRCNCGQQSCSQCGRVSCRD